MHYQVEAIPDELKCIYLNIGNNSCIDIPSWDFRCIMPLYEFIPLRLIQREMDISNEVAIELPEIDTGYKPDMIPFLYNQSGCSYYFRTLPNDSSIHYIDKVEGRFYQCSDLGVFFDMLSEQYENNVYFIGEDGRLKCNYDLEEEISKKYSSQGY